MSQKIYIRFTSDIYADIERGSSIDFRDKSKLPGLCAWGTSFATLINSKDEILEGCKIYAKQVAKNTYGGYGSSTEVAIITGSYVGSSNDGVMLKDIEVIDTFSI